MSTRWAWAALAGAVAAGCGGHEAVDDWEARAREKAAAAALERQRAPAATGSPAEPTAASGASPEATPDDVREGAPRARRPRGPAITERVAPPRGGHIVRLGRVEGGWRYEEYEVGESSVEMRFRWRGDSRAVREVQFDGLPTVSWSLRPLGADTWVYVVVPRDRFVVGAPVEIRWAKGRSARFVAR